MVIVSPFPGPVPPPLVAKIVAGNDPLIVGVPEMSPVDKLRLKPGNGVEPPPCREKLVGLLVAVT